MPGARIIRGERVTLRTVEREDVPFISRHTANPQLRLPTGNSVRNQASLEGGVQNGFGDDTPMVICLDEDQAGPGPADEDEVDRIGLVQVTDNGRNRPELAVFVIPKKQGEGYGTEATSLLIDHVFNTNHHPAVGATAFPHNEASQALLESLGFTREGRIRNQLFWDGQYRDQLKYGLLREEWRNRGDQR